MILGTQIIQAYRVECDRCGEPAPWEPTVAEARATAAGKGYRTSRWAVKGCPRELVLCPGCWAESRVAAGVSEGVVP